MLTVGLLQVTVPVLEADIAVGGVTFCVTTTWLVAVQLLAGLVTVKVYVPGVLIDALGVVAITPLPLLQLKVAPVVDELPFNVALVATQVSCIGVALALISGGAVSAFTVAVAVALQVPAVTVNV